MNKFGSFSKLRLPDAANFGLEPLNERFDPKTIRVLAQNSLGRVIRVLERDTQEELCVKIPTNEGAESFEREIIARRVYLATLSDSDADLIVPDKGLVYETKYGNEPYNFGLVLPYVEGGSMNQVLDYNLGAVMGNYSRVAEFALGMAMSLRALNIRRLVHNDIKPENFVLTRKFNNNEHVAGLNLIDFGSANVASGWTGENLFQDFGTPFFTAAYVSPENAIAEYNVTSRSDLYSMAVVMLELLQGTNPYSSANPLESMGRHIKGIDRSALKMLKTKTGDAPENVKAVNNLIFSLLEPNQYKRGKLGSLHLQSPEDVIQYLLSLDWSGTALVESPIYKKANGTVQESTLKSPISILSRIRRAIPYLRS